MISITEAILSQSKLSNDDYKKELVKSTMGCYNGKPLNKVSFEFIDPSEEVHINLYMEILGSTEDYKYIHPQ